MRLLGIDPGASGGLALIGEGIFYSAKCVPMPDTIADLHAWLFENCKDGIDHAIVEQVSGYAGGPGQPGSAMFKFGSNYGAIKMALYALHIPFEEVVPRKWQAAFGISVRKAAETKTQFKNRIKAVAQQLFPSTHVTLATADALLIAEYCKRSKIHGIGLPKTRSALE